MGIAGIVFTKEQSMPSADVFGAKAAVQGGFAAVIGASCSAVLYESWKKSQDKPINRDYKTYVEDMRKAGFTDEKYSELASDLIKLFYYRECLLIGSMRSVFIDRYYNQQQNNNPMKINDLNLAIEVYFLEQLNSLFQQTFQSIYALHDKEIEDEKQLPAFIHFFKQHFKSEENQKRFTQKMQLDFMTQCIHFLQKQMDEPGFLGKHPYFIDSFAGLMAATIAVGYFAINVLFISTFGLVCIGVVSASIAAICTHLTINNIESIYYQRDKINRSAIHNAILSITKEQKRLAVLTQAVVQTSRKDLEDLKKYDNQDKSAFLNILKLKKERSIALGGVRAWIREFASRFQESEFIQINLSDRLKAIINDAHDQTEALEKNLTNILLASSPSSADNASLNKFIQDTSHYILNPKDQDFIRTFEYIQKTKEQVLEIVSSLPGTCASKALPASLIDFYTKSRADGGLGGLLSDLDQARTIAPVVADSVPTDSHHPYHQFLDTALTLDLKLNASFNASLILHGDSTYRHMLGLSCAHSQNVVKQINPSNIKSYLTASFDFLCSLNDYTNSRGWNEPFQNHTMYVLYRMLLIKQLASLADPNNIHVDKIVQEDIKRFAQEKLNCNADVAFDDIRHQALLINTHPNKKSIDDQFHKPHPLSELAFIADAIRVDIAYCSTALSPRQLINLEAQEFLKNNKGKLIFGINSSDALIPAFSDDFYKDVNDAIVTSSAFIKNISSHQLLVQTQSIARYFEVVLSEIESTKNQISQLIALETQIRPLNNDALLNIITKLNQFKKDLIPASTHTPPVHVVAAIDTPNPNTALFIPEHPNAQTLLQQRAVESAESKSTLDEIIEDLRDVTEHIEGNITNLFIPTHAEKKAEDQTHEQEIIPCIEETPAKTLSAEDTIRINRLRAYMASEDKHRLLFFSHHTPQDKKTAAEQAILAIQEHKAIENKICHENKHLKDILGL